MKYLRVVGSLAVYNYLDVCQEALCILPIRMVCTVHQAATIILVFLHKIYLSGAIYHIRYCPADKNLLGDCDLMMIYLQMIREPATIVRGPD
jgi:hypothetical protein